MPGGVGAVGAGTYFSGLLTDQQVAAVVTCVRTRFGKEYSEEVTAADARASRPR
jgi:mono/diheme cytochrome c family protein